MEDQWQVLKEEIMLVRQGKDSEELFELSEHYFQLADTTVTAAEQYTEKQVNRTSRGFGILILGAMGVWEILVWQERRQDKMQAVIRERKMPTGSRSSVWTVCGIRFARRSTIYPR